MKFDKSKILTCVTADQAKVGMSGWFSDNLMDLEEQIKSNSPKGVILDIYSMRAPNRFVDEDTTAWNLFYPAPEQTYFERQAEWVKENNVTVGTKVRVTRTFTENEDGSCCWEHDDLVGMIGSVDEYGIDTHNLVVTMSDGYSRAIPYFVLEVIKEPTYEERQAEWVKENNVRFGTKVRFTKNFTYCEDGSGCCGHKYVKGMEGVVKYAEDDYLYVLVPYFGCLKVPFTTLEVIKEPTYRPYNNDELNDLVGEVLTNKKSGRKKLVTGKSMEGLGVNLDGSYITAKDLLSSFYRNTNEPCGMKE